MNIQEEFIPFPKMARLSREIIISEKIDGTNASIKITEDGQFLTGSRTRWITPQDDNFGFSKWANENKEELMKLGVGMHFGEWWGSGIQRGYGLPKGEKRFSLFNTTRWSDGEVRPKCCLVVPILYMGDFNTDAIENCLNQLRETGSEASKGFTNPEGIVIYHTAGSVGFKKTCYKDEIPKGMLPK